MQKIFFNKWCAHILRDDKIIGCRKLIVANFRPGNITPEEFINCVMNLLDEGNFARVLFNSTTLLQMRFPLLSNENLFLPALIDLFKSRNVVSIFVETLGGGARKDLSFELSNLADYLIKVENKDIMFGIKNEEEDKVSFNSSEIVIDNIRGKDYKKNTCHVTIRPFKITEDSCNIGDKTKFEEMCQDLKEHKIIGENGEILANSRDNGIYLESLLKNYHNPDVIRKILQFSNELHFFNKD